MDLRPDPPRWLPATTTQAPRSPSTTAPRTTGWSSPDPSSQLPPTPSPQPSPQRPGRHALWRRLTRSRRGAAGLAIVSAALLLWPFAGLSWIPWLAGFVVLVLVRLLRLDGLLRGWDVHVAGLAVVAGLMISTTPWAWALAGAIGVLIAGLAQLPAWKLAAVGAVLCVLAGAGYTWAAIRDARDAAAAYEPVRERSRQDQGVPRRDGVLPILLNRIAQGSPDAVCDNLLAEPARAAFAASAGQPDCDAAVLALAARVTDRTGYARADAPADPAGDGLVVDACALSWGLQPAAGPQLGHLTITATSTTPPRYAVTSFRPC